MRNFYTGFPDLQECLESMQFLWKGLSEHVGGCYSKWGERDNNCFLDYM